MRCDSPSPTQTRMKGHCTMFIGVVMRRLFLAEREYKRGRICRGHYGSLCRHYGKYYGFYYEPYEKYYGVYYGFYYELYGKYYDIYYELYGKCYGFYYGVYCDG